MEHKVFFEHYRICETATGSPEELGRSGAAIVYKATDVRSSEPVALQLVPIASLDPDTRDQFEERAHSAKKLDHVNIARVLEVGVEAEFLVLVSELVQGETSDAWVVANGPMSPEAVLHVGLQVVRALEAATFFSLTHRALQPSNIMIVPGAAPDGGWPFVKLLNFGLASAESHAFETPGAALAPSVAPQFASPEQLHNQPLDFPSEVYSLAATMCFLLTGAAPLANGNADRLRRFPQLHRIPRGFRNLLGSMLSEKPEDRPQDRVALQEVMLKSLTDFERRQSIHRKLGIPMMAALPRLTMGRSPVAQIARGAIAFALLVLLAGGLAAEFFPGILRLVRPDREFGVPIGVPQSQLTAEQTTTAAASVTPAPSAIAASRPEATTAPSVAPTESAPQIAAANSPTEAQAPAEGPDESSASLAGATSQAVPPDRSPNKSEDAEGVAKNSSRSDETVTSSRSQNKTKNSNSVASANRSRVDQDQSDEPSRSSRAYVRRGSFRSRVIGSTPDGRPILRLPSGRVVIVMPGAPVQEVPAPRGRAIVREPDLDDGQPPWQPFLNGPRD